MLTCQDFNTNYLIIALSMEMAENSMLANITFLSLLSLAGEPQGGETQGKRHFSSVPLLLMNNTFLPGPV